jgi:hypothetical protein
MACSDIFHFFANYFAGPLGFSQAFRGILLASGERHNMSGKNLAHDV